jgi:hypothetical protein
MRKRRIRLARWLALVMLIALAACSKVNSNLRVEISQGTSRLVPGVKRYSGFSFEIFEVVIDGRKYLVNSEGGIIEVRP